MPLNCTLRADLLRARICLVHKRAAARSCISLWIFLSYSVMGYCARQALWRVLTNYRLSRSTNRERTARLWNVYHQHPFVAIYYTNQACFHYNNEQLHTNTPGLIQRKSFNGILYYIILYYNKWWRYCELEPNKRAQYYTRVSIFASRFVVWANFGVVIYGC